MSGRILLELDKQPLGFQTFDHWHPSGTSAQLSSPSPFNYEARMRECNDYDYDYMYMRLQTKQTYVIMGGTTNFEHVMYGQPHVAKEKRSHPPFQALDSNEPVWGIMQETCVVPIPKASHKVHSSRSKQTIVEGPNWTTKIKPRTHT